MSLDIRAVQEALRKAGLDGWLFYDFRGNNPLAYRVLSVLFSDEAISPPAAGTIYVPARGEPLGSRPRHRPGGPARRSSPGARASTSPGEKSASACLKETRLGGREAGGHGVLAQQRHPDHLPGRRRHPRAHPLAGRRGGLLWRPRVVASSRCGAPRQLALPPRHAAEIALPGEGSRVRNHRPPPARSAGDHRVRHPVADGAVARRGRADHRRPIRSSRPRRTPATRTTSLRPMARAAIARDNVVLLDLWGKTRAPGAVFADISWMGFTGADVPAPVTAAFTAARDARDAAVTPDRIGGRGRPAGTRLGGRPRRPLGDRSGRVRSVHHPPHRPQPRRNGARQRRAPGRLRNA